MAVTSIMTTESIIKSKVGANVSSGVTETMYNDWVLEAESFVNVWIRRNYSDEWSGLNVDVKWIFSDVVSNMVAIMAISYDMSGYTKRAEAESMITILRDAYMRILSLLRDEKNTTFITGET